MEHDYKTLRQRLVERAKGKKFDNYEVHIKLMLDKASVYSEGR